MLLPTSLTVCAVLSCLLVVGLSAAELPAVDPPAPNSPIHQKVLESVKGHQTGHLPLEAQVLEGESHHDAKAAQRAHEVPDGRPISDARAAGFEAEEDQSVLAAAAAQAESGLLGQNACSDQSCREDDDDDDEGEKEEGGLSDGENKSEEDRDSHEETSTGSASGGETDTMSIRFEPAGGMTMDEHERHVLKITLMCARCQDYTIDVTFLVIDPNIAVIENNGSSILEDQKDGTYQANVTIYGRFLGKTGVTVYFNYEQEGTRVEKVHEVQYSVTVAHERGSIDVIFDNLMTVFLVISTMTFGCELDWKIIKVYLRRPWGILIGLTCQYGFMPCIAILGDWLFHLPTYMDYGLLAYSCCPGGGASNIYTVLLGGELNLSLIMTFMSTIVSIGMMPLWMYTVGPMFGDGEAQIPFFDIFTSLLLLVCPLIAGLLVATYLPRVARMFVKGVRPVAMTVYLFLVMAGFYINRFIFQLIADYGFQVAVPSILLPYLGFILAMLAALALRQPWFRVKTISIETGVQNLTLALVLLRNSLQSPASALSAVCPVISGLATPIPILIAFSVRFGMRKCCGEEEEEEDEFEKAKNTIPVIGDVLEKKRTDSVLTTMTELDPADLPGWNTKGDPGTPLSKPRTASFTLPPDILPPARPRSESFRLYEAGEVEVGVAITTEGSTDPFSPDTVNQEDSRSRSSSVTMPPDYEDLAENVATTSFVSRASSMESLETRSRSTSILMTSDVPLMRDRSMSNLENPGLAEPAGRVRSSSVIMQPDPNQEMSTPGSLNRAESNTAVNAIVTTLKKVGKMLQGDEYELEGTIPKPKSKKSRSRTQSKDSLDEPEPECGALPQ